MVDNQNGCFPRFFPARLLFVAKTQSSGRDMAFRETKPANPVPCIRPAVRASAMPPSCTGRQLGPRRTAGHRFPGLQNRMSCHLSPASSPRRSPVTMSRNNRHSVPKLKLRNNGLHFRHFQNVRNALPAWNFGERQLLGSGPVDRVPVGEFPPHRVIEEHTHDDCEFSPLSQEREASCSSLSSPSRASRTSFFINGCSNLDAPAIPPRSES